MPAFKGYYADGLKMAFSNLRGLKMLLSHLQGGRYSGTSFWKQWLPDFLAFMPRLQHLSLTFAGIEVKHPSDEPYARQAFAAFAQKSSMPHLTRLELSNCAVNPPDLRRLFDHHTQTLMNITLNRILLVSGSWRGDIFGALQTRVGTLWEFRVAWLMERKSSEEEQVVVFNMKGFNGCIECRLGVSELAMTADEHVSKTLTAEEADGEVDFTYRPMEAFKRR